MTVRIAQDRLNAQTADLLDAIRIASTSRTPEQDEAAENNAIAAVWATMEAVNELTWQEEEEDRQQARRRLSRTERLQAAADAGVDTWEEIRGER